MFKRKGYSQFPMDKGKQITIVEIYNNIMRSGLCQVVARPVVLPCMEIVAQLIKRADTSNK